MEEAGFILRSRHNQIHHGAENQQKPPEEQSLQFAHVDVLDQIGNGQLLQLGAGAVSFPKAPPQLEPWPAVQP